MRSVATSVPSAGGHCDIKTIVFMPSRVFCFSHDGRFRKADEQPTSTELCSVKRVKCLCSFLVVQKASECKRPANTTTLLFSSMKCATVIS